MPRPALQASSDQCRNKGFFNGRSKPRNNPATSKRRRRLHLFYISDINILIRNRFPIQAEPRKSSSEAAWGRHRPKGIQGVLPSAPFETQRRIEEGKIFGYVNLAIVSFQGAKMRPKFRPSEQDCGIRW
jgi:hypothetical protein